MPGNFYFLNSNLISASENERAHAGFLTADTAGQRDYFFSPLHGCFSTWSGEHWQDLNWWHFVVFKGRGLIILTQTSLQVSSIISQHNSRKEKYNYRSGVTCVVNLKVMELHNPGPCNVTLHPAASWLFLMSVSLSRRILPEMVTAYSTYDITPVVNHPLCLVSCKSFV